jgi:hypothetical protein
VTDRREMEEPPVRRLVWESPAAPEQTILRAREGIRFSLASCSHADERVSSECSMIVSHIVIMGTVLGVYCYGYHVGK